MKNTIFISGTSPSALPSLKGCAHIRHGNLLSLEGCGISIIVSENLPDNFTSMVAGYQAHQCHFANYVVTSVKNFHEWRKLVGYLGVFVIKEDSADIRDHFLCNICGLGSYMEHNFYKHLITFGLGTIVRTQYRIGEYKCDFVFPTHKLVVETDGHDYHSTKEARARDASKDRYLSLNGWTVIRFTGDEIKEDIHKCINCVKEFLK